MGRVLRKFAVGTTALVVLCIGAEVVTRALAPHATSAGTSVVPRHIGRFDPELGWALEPGAVGVSRTTGHSIEYRINSLGYRDDETTYAKPAGTFRIVVLGDSRTFGFGVPIEKHFTRLLEGYFSKVEVINLGVSGYGVDQELLTLRTTGLRYEPDLVLAYVAHYADQRHMHTRRFGREKPSFGLRGSGIELTNSPVVESELPPARGRALHNWLRRRSAFYALLRNFAAAAPPPSNEELHPRKPILLQGSPRSGHPKQPRHSPELRALGEAIVFAMHSESREKGAAFALITQIASLHAALQSRGIESLDVSGALANPMFELPDGLGHINEAGNGALALELVRFLKEHGLVPRQHWAGWN